MHDKVCEISKYIVKITRNNNFIGSGVLWKPNPDSDNTYVFTAMHLFTGVDFDYDIELWNGDIFKGAKLIRYIDTYPNVNELPYRESDKSVESVESVKSVDAAVLVINDKNVPATSYELISPEMAKMLIYNENTNLELWGYPEKRSEYNSNLEQQYHIPCFLSNIASVHESNSRFVVTYKDERIGYDPNLLFTGLSGGGLFAYVGDAVFLCGIHKGFKSGDGGNYNDLEVTSMEPFNRIFINKRFDIPKTCRSFIPKSLKKNFLEYIESLSDENKNEKHMMIDLYKAANLYDFTKIIENICNHCKPCAYNEYYYLCKDFKVQFIKSCALLMGHNKLEQNTLDIEDENYFQVNKDGKEHKVRIICCDAKNERVNEFIRSLKKDDMGKMNLPEDALVLWLSKKYNHSAAKCTFERYKNIVADITAAEKKPWDTTDINEAAESLAIINVQYVVNELEDNPNAFVDFIRTM